MLKKIYISSCVEAGRGKNKFGKDWVRYTVKDAGGTYYSTFDGKYAQMVGMEAEVNVEQVEKGGKTYLNLVEPKKGTPETTELTKRINDMARYCQQLEHRIVELEVGRGAKIVAGARELRAEAEEVNKEIPF